MATHGVVQARLILDGRDMGPHLFICQSASSAVRSCDVPLIRPSLRFA